MRVRKTLSALALTGLLGAALVSPAAAQTAPTANDDTATVAEDQSVSVNVLANDTPTGVTIDSVGKPSNGKAVVSAGNILYTPKADFHGTDSFTYKITDGDDTDSATVTVTVTPVNDAPEARDDQARTRPGTAVEVNVLKNDKDADGDDLVVSLVSPPAHGTVVLNTTTQRVTYTPTAGYTGTDTFTYRASDSSLASDVATVTVTVKEKAATGTDERVVTACEGYTGPVGGVQSLCRLYLGQQLPPWVQAKIGQIILRHTVATSNDEVAEVCAGSDNSADVERLCDAYESGWLPPGLQKKVGRMILDEANGTNTSSIRVSIDDDDDRRERRDRDDRRDHKDRDDDRADRDGRKDHKERGSDNDRKPWKNGPWSRR